MTSSPFLIGICQNDTSVKYKGTDVAPNFLKIALGYTMTNSYYNMKLQDVYSKKLQKFVNNIFLPKNLAHRGLAFFVQTG